MHIVKFTDEAIAMFPYIKEGHYVILHSSSETQDILDQVQEMHPDRPVRIRINPGFIEVEEIL